MILRVNGKESEEAVNERLITNSLYTIPIEKKSSIMLAKNRVEFIQTSGSPANGFMLEYQDSTAQYFKSENDNLSIEQVSKALKSYYNQNDKWKAGQNWEKSSFAVSTRKKSGKIANIIYGLAVAAYLIWKYFFTDQ